MYPTALEATNDGTQSVHLSWSHPANVDLLKHYVLYRDGQKVTNIDPSATSFEDVNVAPGVSHMYHLAALQAEEEYARTARGSIVGKGLITAQILTGQGTGVLGDSLLLQASVNGITYQDTAYANAEGKVYFRNLAYDTEGITYTISPAGNVQHYDRASSLVTLDESLSQSFADAFINQQTRTIAGTVTNLYCQTGCGRDSLELILFSINEAGERRMVTDTKTDHLGRFSFAIPYYLSGFTAYEVEIPNQALNGEGQPMDPYGYYYQAGENMQVNPEDSTLVITFPVEHLITKKAHQVAVYEQSHHPLTVEIAGPGDCDVFTGYEFVVRIRDRGGKLDLRLDTENRRISQTLPPYDFEITVLDVNKPDAFSAAVLDYFRSRPLHVNNRGHYTRFLDSEVEEPENPVRHMRYNERTNLSISGTETVLDNKCGTYVMAEDQEITVTVTPEQIINGKPCSATSGYILAKFKGGEVTDLDNDTLEYVNGAWESLLVKATTPNLVAPYTQLLELYYYDANGNYQGFATEEILVTGQQQNPGADIFVINDNPYPVLLNVLRDPPGDKSYASIEEKSSYQIQLERTKKSSWEYGLEREHTNTAAGYTLISKINSSHGVDNSRTSSLNYSVEFTEGLSTLKNAQLSENLESYLDGPDADVLVGVNLILAYGMTEVLEYNSCVPTKTRNLGVNPAGISTMWAYTRSQIENTVRYYEDVTTPGSGYVVESTDTNVASSQQIIQDIANSRENFQRILEVADTQFTPICEMCTYVANNSTNSTSRRIDRFDDIDEVLGYRNEISNFCTTYAGYNKEKQECSSAPIQEILTSWDDATRNLYDVIYRKYLTLHELERFHHSNSERELDFSQWEETVEKISFFEPIENITFGGGSKVSRSYGSSSSETDKYSHDHILSLSLKLGGKMHLTFDVQAWFGFGGGTYVENVKEADATTAIHGHVKTKQTWSYAINQTTGQSFKTKFSLDDKDDGDHYSVDVLQSGVYANTRMTPFFNVVGGRSSCPYVPGTISRDQPTLQLLDEQGNQMPTKYFDLDPEVPFALPISVSSGNPFGENRLIMVAAPLGSNRNGLNTEIEGIRVNSYRGATVWVEADTSYQTTLYLNKRDLPAYDFEDIQIIAKPACMGNKFTYFEEAHVIDTLELEFHFRKPISPITLESDLGDWFVIDDVDPNATESVTFKLRDYDVEQNQHSLKEIVIEYKRVNDEVWTRITDATQQTETLSVEVLLAYYQEMLNTYSEPTYPFVWQLPHDLVDGQYQVRAMVVHENGSIAYSNILTGTVDRTAPRIVGTTSPADSLLSQGDEIAISFDEALDCETFLNGTNVSVKVLADDVHAEVELFKTVDFSYTCSGSGIVITINPAKLQAYDGRRWEVQVRSITDWLGNASDPIAPTWQFQVDYFKQSPSSVTLVGPEDWRINAATAEQTLHFAITDYDVFQASTSLSEIALQYKRDVDADWLTASTLTVAQLEARHRAQGVADEIPIDTLNWDASTVLDGSYTVRAVATGNTGR
ncbi:MAG TPA: hypothetical protein DCE41_08130, partial [Cytophagales bacterium]|nr:hypothetical protein [Cytophagales bacterium]